MSHFWPPATYIDEDGPPLTFQALAARTTAPATRPAPRTHTPPPTQPRDKMGGGLIEGGGPSCHTFGHRPRTSTNTPPRSRFKRLPPAPPHLPPVPHPVGHPHTAANAATRQDGGGLIEGGGPSCHTFGRRPRTSTKTPPRSRLKRLPPAPPRLPPVPAPPWVGWGGVGGPARVYHHV